MTFGYSNEYLIRRCIDVSYRTRNYTPLRRHHGFEKIIGYGSKRAVTLFFAGLSNRSRKFTPTWTENFQFPSKQSSFPSLIQQRSRLVVVFVVDVRTATVATSAATELSCDAYWQKSFRRLCYRSRFLQLVTTFVSELVLRQSTVIYCSRC